MSLHHQEKVGALDARPSSPPGPRQFPASLCGDADHCLGDERGEIASWVVVTALVVVAAIVIVGIVVTKLTNTANNIQTP